MNILWTRQYSATIVVATEEEEEEEEQVMKEAGRQKANLTQNGNPWRLITLFIPSSSSD